MPVEITLDKVNANDTTVEVVRWLVDDGAHVRAGDEVLEVESSKAVTAVTAENDGHLKQLVTVGEHVEIGRPLALLYASGDELAAHSTAPNLAPSVDAGPAGARFSASARQELVRHGLDPHLFAGQGLVTAEAVRAMATAGAAVTPSALRRSISPAKRTEIERLTAGAAALASALTVTLASAQLREALASRQPMQPSVLAVTVHAVALALRDHPELNARFAGDHVECYPDVNVGVAVDLGSGLRVPVIRNADRSDPDDLTFALLELMATYEERRLGAAELTGATVTVSDLSGDDVLQFQPRINQDQTLALGVGADSTLPGHPMTLTAVFDHRASTGRSVAGFLGQVKAHLVKESTR